MTISSVGAAALALYSWLPARPSEGERSLEWTRLDADLASLSTAVADAEPGLVVKAWMKTAYRASPDIQVSGNDEGGVQLSNARLEFAGKVGGFELKASVDGAAGPVTVRDFIARTKLTDAVSLQAGNYRAPFLFSGVSSDWREILYDRTTQGSLWSAREAGVALDGSHGRFAWSLSAQNGGDSGGDEQLVIAKAAVGAIGDVVMPKQTGGYGPDAKTSITIGVGYVDDGSALVGSASALSAEVVATSGGLFALAEVVDYDDGFTPGNIGAGAAKRAADANAADTTPWGATLGYMFTERDEAALRYDDLDDANDTSRVTLGYTRYASGHAAKFQLNFASQESDAGDVDELIAGITVSL